MAVASIITPCVHGAQVVPVRIEVDIQPGLPLFTIIGLPDKRIDEAKERVCSALKNSGQVFPLGKITINLSPSNMSKAGTAFDLGIALGILVASSRIRALPDSVWVLGELSLDGLVRPINPLPAYLVEALKCKVKGVLMPVQATKLLVPRCEVASLGEVVSLCQKDFVFKTPKRGAVFYEKPASYLIDQIVGQTQAERALAIALAGGHNVIFSGPPGSGKTMLAQAAAELMPEWSYAEYLDVLQLHTLARNELVTTRPFRSPHHTTSRSGLFGGGNPPKPGEISLAHLGILFLDEFPEFSREARESLRQPMQDKKVTLTRAGQTFTFPAKCLVIAAQNYCPCGLYGAEGEECRCTPSERSRYATALSEPLLERFDLFSDVPKLEYSEYANPLEITGKQIGELVVNVRKVSTRRNMKGYLTRNYPSPN